MDDKQKIEFLVRSYYKAMHMEAERILGDYHMAEDACQDTVIKLMNAAKYFRNIESVSVKNYCFVVLRHTARDIARKWNRQIPQELKEDDERIPMKIDHYPFETEEMILDILSLPDHYKAVLTLRCFEKKSCHETAEITGSCVGTVNCRLNRARKILKQKWNIVA